MYGQDLISRAFSFPRFSTFQSRSSNATENQYTASTGTFWGDAQIPKTPSIGSSRSSLGACRRFVPCLSVWPLTTLFSVSHHPPVTALHATDERKNIEILWCQSPMPKFYGTHIETEIRGKRILRLHERNETYAMNSPNLSIRFLPVPGCEWSGNVKIQCRESVFEAELCYRGSSFLSRPSTRRSIKGKIFQSSTLKTVCEVDGHWDRIVTVKDVTTGKSTTIYDAREALSNLKIPTVKDAKSVMETESTVVWGETSRAILEKNWERAREAKTLVEEKQRELARERRSKQRVWCPKHFTLLPLNSDESGWECLPNHRLVPPAPIAII